MFFIVMQSELLLMAHSYCIYIDENNIQTSAGFSTQCAGQKIAFPKTSQYFG